MKANWKYPVLSLIAITAAGSVHPALATVPVLTAGQSVPFVVNTGTNNPNFEYNGLYYQLTACSGGVCGASGAIIEAVVVSNVPQIEVVDAPGTPLLSVTVPSSGQTAVDMTYDFNVWAASTKTTINSATNIAGGTASSSSSDLSLISSSATITPYPGSSSDDLISTVVTTSAPYTFASVSPTSVSVLSVAYDVSVHTFGGTAGDVLKLNNVNLILSPAPEPASVALLATGLTGLVAARRRMKRRA